MIPLRDINPVANRPWMTWSCIALTSALWLFQVSLGPDGGRALVLRFGLVPALLGEPARSVTPITSLFLHGGWLHLIGNLWFLYVFGDNVEDRLGRARYVLLYLASGLLAALSQVLLDPSSQLPMVGASGAIAGVLGAYVLLFPRARVVALIFVQFVEVPAYLFLFVWLGLQVVLGLFALGGAGELGGVAFFAHVGGFLAGLVLARWLAPRAAAA